MRGRVSDYVEELQPELENGLGCIIFNLACYFPYEEQDLLRLSFKVGLFEPTDFKLNHRYPNHRYVTLSKKTGRKLSKMGYSFFCKLGEDTILFMVKVGLNDSNEEISMVFPLRVNLSKEKPVSALTFHFNFESSCIDIHTTKRDGCGWLSTQWTTDREFYESYDQSKGKLYLFHRPVIENTILMFEDIISLEAQSVDDLLIW